MVLIKNPKKNKLEYERLIKEMGVELIKTVETLETRISETEEGFEKFSLQIDVALNRTNYYIIMYELGIDYLHAHKDEYLSKARQTFMGVLDQIERVYTKNIDTTFSEIIEGLEKNPVSFKAVNQILIKISITLNYLKRNLYESAKYKYVYIELAGRVAAVLKNMFNFKEYQEKRDPRIEGYEDREFAIKEIMQMLEAATNGFREKFEMQGNDPGNMVRALDYLSMLRKIHVIAGDTEEAENLKKRSQTWKSRLDSYLKKMEEMKKK